MRFLIGFNQLTYSLKSEIEESLKKEELTKLEDESRKSEPKMTFKEFMTHRNYYNLNPESYDIELQNLLYELVERRINQTFKNLEINL